MNASQGWIPEPLDDDAFEQALAGEVRSAVSRKHLRQKDAGHALGMTPNQISRRWHGETSWSHTELILLCDFLGIDYGDLMGAAKRVVRENEHRQGEAG